MPSALPTDDRPVTGCASGLYIVATPIGNLEDITLRAIRILGGVDLIAAEDTRHTTKLLSHYDIHTPLISCHEHNEQQRTAELIEKIRSGASVALVSDAGTPSVSDPGYRLVCAAVEAGLDIFPVPGVSAAITALCASGLPTDRFVFVGFAPRKKGRRLELLQSLAADDRTLVFYESPRRIMAFLIELQSVMGDRPAVLAREMTKLHEEFIRGPFSRIMQVLRPRPEVKGECTILVAGAPPSRPIDTEALGNLLRERLARPDARISSISKELAGLHQLPRKRVYELALSIQKEIRNGGGGS
ncbi:ribosomal RNA small subunit methyltransferase I [Desulfosarcina ovata subsp. sediminis]|uniref:Ribosomal RNA small subunit methyltransferase I n=1 Tax=Desulfosarcina ovata subsp. sediminis TaxID=885957 RepID=A0A5K7ZQK1_9BACT|nr:16S rRNA (cytidine(1402)-2'-O)-methyltransferase [Desulfosarcina ovata]BBO81980.1 ribosomal RNA small subunit methyltransferase I [Desulfosarcina ovata subsp. sediminis]